MPHFTTGISRCWPHAQALEARQQQDREWQQGSTITLTVEVEHFQASLVSERGLGTLLLGMPSALLTGRTLSGADKVMSLDVSQVSWQDRQPQLQIS